QNITQRLVQDLGGKISGNNEKQRHAQRIKPGIELVEPCRLPLWHSNTNVQQDDAQDGYPLGDVWPHETFLCTHLFGSAPFGNPRPLFKDSLTAEEYTSSTGYCANSASYNMKKSVNNRALLCC